MGAIWFRFRKNKLALIGLIMMAGILFLVIFANIFIDESFSNNNGCRKYARCTIF